MLFSNFITVLFVFFNSVSALELLPISDAADLTGNKNEKRGTKDDMDLQDLETFIWGAPAGNKLIYANLTVYFPEEYERIISMERFAGKLKSVRCEEDMMLEFVDHSAFEYAKNVWNWVNDDVNRTFIMVTNYEGCADNMERLPFAVTDIDYDEVNNRAHLKADLKEWEDIAHSYTLNVGHMPLTPAHRMLMSRHVLPRDVDFTMDLTSGFDKDLFSATVGSWTSRVNADVRTVGKLNVDMDIDVSWLQLKSASMSISPEDVAASIQLALTEEGTLTKPYNWKKTIISIPISGVSIAKIVKLGAFLDVDVGFTMDEWAGKAQASIGARMALSNSAIVKIDLVNSKNNKFSGWTPTFTPIPLTLNAKVEGSARVYAEPNVKLEASALGKGWNVGLNLQMPYIEADFAAMYDSAGVCSTKKTLGVDVDARIGVELSAQAATKGNEADPFWEQSLFSREWNLFSKCLAFGPSNAKTGDHVDPNPPKSKKPKSKKPKPTPKPSKKPKPKSSKKPKPTPTPTPKPKPSKKPTPKPTPVAKSSKKPKSTATDDEPTKSAPSKSQKPSSASKPSSDKSKSRSITNHSVSKTDSASHSRHTLSSSSTFSGFTNSSRSHPDPTKSGENDPSSTASRSATLSKSATGSGSEPSGTDKPSGSSDGSPSESGTTKPPSTFMTITSTSSSASSSSSAEVCDIKGKGKGCSDCNDPEDLDPETEEYFAIEVEGGLEPALENNNETDHKLLRRFSTREYTFVCGDVSHPVFMARYPTYADRIDPKNSITVSEWYLAESSTVCTNHKISTHSANPPTTVVGARSLQFEMEHVYEGNWILNFLRELATTHNVECKAMDALFFHPPEKGTNNRGETWAQALMHSLGSRYNQDDLVFLWKNINGAKHRIFKDGDGIIAADKWKGKAKNKLERIATVGRALDYMAQDRIGTALRDTATNVELTLSKFVDSLSSEQKKMLGDLGEKGALAKTHRSWLNSFMHSRNDYATKKMSSWASVASEVYETETPGSPRSTGADGVVKHADGTLSFLQALQTDPPKGFNAGKWAPLI